MSWSLAIFPMVTSGPYRCFNTQTACYGPGEEIGMQIILCVVAGKTDMHPGQKSKTGEGCLKLVCIVSLKWNVKSDR